MLDAMNACRFCGRVGRFYRDEPKGYVAWFEWVERMSRRYEQRACPDCGRFTIWRLRRSDAMIERVELRGLGAHGFGRWLEGWKRLQREGYDVTVLVALDRSHAIGLAYREGSA